MKRRSDDSLFKNAEQLEKIVNSLGIYLSLGSDFREFWKIPMIQPARHPVNPAFNPNYCDLNEGNAFWITGHNEDGEIVHTQAVKLLDLRGDTFADYLNNNIWDFRSSGYDLAHEKTEWYLSPEASRIVGRVTYHGEVWLKAGRGGYRGGSLMILLTRYLLLKALLRWSPDYMTGLQAPLTTCRGLGVREGYMRAEQRTIVWHQQNCDEPMEDWMVWMSGEDARYNLRLPAEFFYQTFKKNNEPELRTLQKQYA